jgi:hypothetical protein
MKFNDLNNKFMFILESMDCIYFQEQQRLQYTKDYRKKGGSVTTFDFIMLMILICMV